MAARNTRLGVAERTGVAEALRLQIRQGLTVNRAGRLGPQSCGPLSAANR